MTRLTLTVSAFALAATGASAEIMADDHRYMVGDMEFEGYVAYNSDLEESKGTVLIVHDWDGLNDYEKRRAEMLAALGYTAFAIDVYGAETRPTNFDENRAFSGALYGDRETFRERLLGSIAEAGNIAGATEDKVIMGYCFGGAAVLESARAGADVEGFISFHGGLGTPEGQDYSATAAPVMLFHGSADPVSGMGDLASLLDQLQEAGVTHGAQVFGGARHSFTVWGSNDYDLDADQGSWEGLLGFLDEAL